MAQLPKVNVVTVGAGLTAGILAQQLTAQGLSVVSLEQGAERHTETNFQHQHDELRYQIRRDMMVDLQNETWTWRPDPKSPSLPMRRYGAFNPGKGVGGASIHWAAQNWRFHESDFRYRSNVVDRYGEDKLPAGSRTQDWGITYEEMEPYYDAWEYDVGISGKAGNLQGKQIEGGNVFEGPRSREYPSLPCRPRLPARSSLPPRPSSGTIRSPNRPPFSPRRIRISPVKHAGPACCVASAHGTVAKSPPREAPSRRTSRWP